MPRFMHDFFGNTDHVLATAIITAILVGLALCTAPRGLQTDPRDVRNSDYCVAGGLAIILFCLALLATGSTTSTTAAARIDNPGIAQQNVQVGNGASVPTLDSMFGTFTDDARMTHFEETIDNTITSTYDVSSVYKLRYNPIAGKYHYTVRYNRNNGCLYLAKGHVVMNTTFKEDNDITRRTITLKFTLDGVPVKLGC